MSDEKKESLAALLSPEREGMKLVNAKLFRGENKLIRREEFRSELRSVAAQRSAGLKPNDGAPRSGKPKIDVRELVSSL